jgi:hypothetical protein
MPSYRKKPDLLDDVSEGRLIEALGRCRQAAIEASTRVKVSGPVYHACHMVTAAIDALATLLTGSKQYFYAQTMRGERSWDKDRSKPGQ